MPYFGSSPRNTNTRSVIDHQSYLGSQADTSTNSGYYTFYCNYTIGNVSVILRGVHMADSDYTATNGTDIRIATSSFTLNNDDVIEIIGHTVPSSQILERSDVNITGGAISNAVLNNTNTYNFLDNSISGDKIDGGTISDSVLKLKSSGNSIVASDGTTGILSESAGAVTLTANEMNVGSNALVVNSSGNVGIGTSSPSNPSGTSLTVFDTSIPRINLKNSTTGDTSTVGGEIRQSGNQFLITNRQNSDLIFGTNNTEKMRINSSGDVKIGSNLRLTHVGGYPALVGDAGTGGIAINVNQPGIVPATTSGEQDNVQDLGRAGIRWDDVYATNGTIQTSDANEKENITTSDLSLDFINQLNPVSYRFIGKTRTHYGLIAQEIESLLSTIGKQSSDFAGFIKSPVTDDDGNETGEYKYGLRYNEFISPIIKAIQEQQTIIESQQSQIDALTARIEALEAGN